jgi:uncharacterized membrane protein YdjX (TVP38/TMEM64 family)
MSRQTARRWLPLLGLMALALAVYASGLHRQLSIATLQEQRGALQGFVSAQPLTAPLAFVLTYAAATALSLPGALLLTLCAGFLFGTWLGSVLSVVGATTGAVAVFLIARTALGSALRDRAGPWLQRMETGFREDAFSYLLVLRLVPLFPFWLVNLVPAFLGVPLTTYALGTFVGIIPGSFVYASVGNGLGAVFDAGGTPDLTIIFKPEILLPIIGLSLLALIPVVYKKLKGKA